MKRRQTRLPRRRARARRLRERARRRRTASAAYRAGPGARASRSATAALAVTPPREWNRPARPVVRRHPRGRGLDPERPVSRRHQLRHRAQERQIPRSARRRRDDRQVPKFRVDMTAPEIAAMIESLFRVRGGTVDFRTLGAAAAPVPRQPRLPVRFRASRQRRIVAPRPGGRRGDRRPALSDPVRRRASHYFDAALPDFEAIVASARRSLGDRPDRASAAVGLAGQRRDLARLDRRRSAGRRLAISRPARSAWSAARSPGERRRDIDVGRRRAALRAALRSAGRAAPARGRARRDAGRRTW